MIINWPILEFPIYCKTVYGIKGYLFCRSDIRWFENSVDHVFDIYFSLSRLLVSSSIINAPKCLAKTKVSEFYIEGEVAQQTSSQGHTFK
jgi:hypothetical protein